MQCNTHTKIVYASQRARKWDSKQGKEMSNQRAVIYIRDHKY